MKVVSAHDQKPKITKNKNTNFKISYFISPQHIA